ncbi:MAG: DNA polymerase I [Planctomycetes bacterium]|nr:DNA polymerase I [Planctomycetota bacterium]
MALLNLFQKIWVIDFEFHALAGSLPLPICLVALELHTGEVLRIWADQLRELVSPPFHADKRCLVVTYFGSAEWSCFLELGWPLPHHVLDLYAEFRLVSNGPPRPSGSGLLGALVAYGLPAMGQPEKDANRELAVRGGPFDSKERLRLLDYCEADVRATCALLRAMESDIDLPRALLRGRYTKSVARMERAGVPLDVPMLEAMRLHWERLKLALIREIDDGFRVYEGTTFKAGLWEQWCVDHNVPWPRLASGRLALDRDTFRAMARTHPRVAPMKELRSTLSELRLERLSVGQDGRNRCLLSPFGSTTGRNQPSSAKFVFGPSAWIRSLIKPSPGCAVAYVDWSQQEFGIAAALSRDRNMKEAYRSSDPYLSFACMAGAAPPDATKKSHKLVREKFKVCALGVLFGMGVELMARRIDAGEADARYLLREHKRVFPGFWRWREAVLDTSDLERGLTTAFGWSLRVTDTTRRTSISNFPMQANGAEMLRLACIRATEEGVKVCAPVHDALLIEAPVDEIDAAVARTKSAMRWASTEVLSGFALEAEAEQVVRYPARYVDDRGRRVWQIIRELLFRWGALPPEEACS